MTLVPSSSTAARLSRGNVRTIVLMGLAASLFIALLAIREAGPIAWLDHAFIDLALEQSASGRKADDTVVVDIDDVSLAAVGQWPWPRYRVASLIQRIAAQKPAAIGLDVLFPEADRSSLTNIQETFKRDFGLEVTFAGVPTGLRDNDGFLGQVMGETGAVGANYFYFDRKTAPSTVVQRRITFDGRTDLLNPNTATGVLVNADAIASQTHASGFVNKQVDEDGVLRRLPLLIAHDGAIYPNLSLATVMQALHLTSGTIESDRDGLSIHIGTHRIPIDDAGYMTLRFYGKPQLYGALSAVDVLNGNFRNEDLKGKVVFIGSSAVGLNDLHNTAVDPRFPGLKVHAVMAEDVLDDEFLRTPSWGSAVIVAECIVIGILMSAMFVAASSVGSVVVGSLLTTGVLLLISVASFVGAGLFVSPGAPIAVVVTLFVLFFVARFVFEKRRAHLWMKQLENARQVTIESMASVAETRDPETGAHIKRTQHYVRAIAEQLKRAGLHTEQLTKDYIELLFISAPLHDIGKVGVPDHILLKAGRLTPPEFEEMKKHAQFGRDIILSTAERIEGENFLVVAGEIAATHHEKWDGTGYPLGLAGDAIPLAGRIMAAADIYDALISRRCYKEPFSHELATRLMREARGTTFDPDVLDAFFAIESAIQAIAAKYRDEPEVIQEADIEDHVLLNGLAGRPA